MISTISDEGRASLTVLPNPLLYYGGDCRYEQFIIGPEVWSELRVRRNSRAIPANYNTFSDHLGM